MPKPAPKLLGDLRGLIAEAREQVARSVNSTLVHLYWQIGTRIRQDVLKNKRAGYGEEIVRTLSGQLTQEFGKGFEYSSMMRMLKFAEAFPDPAIVAALSPQLGWSHFREIIPIENALKREFYAEMCRMERWSVRTLRGRIDTLLFERTAISKQPDNVLKESLKALREDEILSPDLVFRDTYFLDFLGLKDTYAEKDVESAILRELESFILEMGSNFSFVARQKRISVDSEDYYLDLLFYHRRLRRLVAIDLKLGKFQAADKGQMELYLRWLEKHDTQPGEEPPIGLVLCAETSSEHVELLQLHKSGIRVAEYFTELPPKKLLEQKLHESVKRARARLLENSVKRIRR